MATLAQAGQISAPARTAGHYRSLDLYRFAAAIGVVLFHYFSIFDLPKNQNLRHLVDFFFILSGFVLMHNYIDMRPGQTWSFVIRRIARIYPLHLATFLFFVAYIMVKARVDGESAVIDSAQIITNLLMIHSWGLNDSTQFNFPSWSISAEWFVYLLFPVILIAYRKLGGFKLLALAVAIGGAMSLYDIASGSDDRSWTLRTHDWGALRALPSFILGMSLRVLPLPQFHWGVVYAGAAIFAALFMLPLPGEVFVIASGLLIAITAGAKGESWMQSSSLAALGNASYGIYMLHIPVSAVLFNPMIDKIVALSVASKIAAGLVASVAAAIVSFNLFERPAQKWVRRKLDRP